MTHPSNDQCALCGGSHKRASCPWREGLVSPFLLQRLSDKLGNPAWYWPSVMGGLFVLIVLGSSVVDV